MPGTSAGVVVLSFLPSLSLLTHSTTYPRLPQPSTAPIIPDSLYSTTPVPPHRLPPTSCCWTFHLVPSHIPPPSLVVSLDQYVPLSAPLCTSDRLLHTSCWMPWTPGRALAAVDPLQRGPVCTQGPTAWPPLPPGLLWWTQPQTRLLTRMSHTAAQGSSRQQQHRLLPVLPAGCGVDGAARVGLVVVWCTLVGLACRCGSQSCCQQLS